MAWWLRTGRVAAGLDPGELPGLAQAEPIDDGPALPLSEEESRLQAADPWFFSHMVLAPRVVCAALGEACGPGRQLLDLGCGDGAMSLGVCRRSGAAVVGCDLTAAFEQLPQRLAALPAGGEWPRGLSFRRVTAGAPLPFADASFDGAFSWSVFEHAADMAQLLGELRRVLKPGAPCFLQIEPLYYSPYGSHLRRLFDEPWCHLRHEPEAFLRLARLAPDSTRPAEQDLLYRENSFEDVRTYLLGEYASLNRVRSVELVRAVREAGFDILRCGLRQVPARRLDADLLRRHTAHDLRTREIRLLLSNPAG